METASNNNVSASALTGLSINSVSDTNISFRYRQTNCVDKVTGFFGEDKGKVFITGTTANISKTNDKEKPFILNDDVALKIRYRTEEDEVKFYKIKIPKGYTWDGASIPPYLQWAVGKKDTLEYAVASMVHDTMCEDHSKIGNDRNLSSNVFKALLKNNGTSKWGANIMAWFVDLYQFCFSGWGKNKAQNIA